MKNYLINVKKSIRNALAKLETNNEKCLIVINDNYKVVGSLTDGDIRRALLKNKSLDNQIQTLIKKKPIWIKINEINLENTLVIDEKIKKCINLIKDDHIDIVPIVNNKEKLLKILFTKDYKKILYKNNNLSKLPVLIMAGGRGTRLKNFTNFFPKPLIPVEDTTAVEYIINNFLNYGVKNFFMSVYYKKNLIKSYLKENKFKNVRFLEEKIPMGTAGAISLLKGKINNDFFLINCDSILSINLENFYEFHKKNNFSITLVASSKKITIPYGTCSVGKSGSLKKISEKPNIKFLASVGLYLMKPEIIKYVTKNKPLDMNNLIEIVKGKKKKIGIFPIGENNWIDVGSVQK